MKTPDNIVNPTCADWMLVKGCISGLKSKLWLWQNRMAHGTRTSVTCNLSGKNDTSTEIHNNIKTKKETNWLKKETWKRHGWCFSRTA